jgi:hypothetical protein
VIAVFTRAGEPLDEDVPEAYSSISCARKRRNDWERGEAFQEKRLAAGREGRPSRRNSSNEYQLSCL